ncbi:transcriptional regulator [Nonomuraea sp. K274]|uniref:Transcriptional regulator n=1 Tax=Nonomuraea cypriaca TaxID=1187855 RepID=A0A931AIJ7_9ACTN|nr:transcriptional regulator [Nonomuraea cypriaca]MBF8189767.1 transcriptional regulator [Nonomuraea cypriaca]
MRNAPVPPTPQRPADGGDSLPPPFVAHPPAENGRIEPAAVSIASLNSAARLNRIAEKAGYVKITKVHVGKRPRTWLPLTAQGRRPLPWRLPAGSVTATCLH